MQRLFVSALLVSLGLGIGGSLLAPRSALAEGPQTAELLAGGKVVGDISNTPGEEDRIGIDLQAGSLLNVKFVPRFAAEFELLDPAGDPVTLDAPKRGRTTAKNVPIASSGRYEFRIAARDGAQGGYKLLARASWPRKITVDGASGGTVDFFMPAGAQVKGSVKAVNSPGFVPRLEALMGPDGDLLAAPIDARRTVVKLPAATAGSYGPYALAVGTAGTAGSFRCVLRVKSPKADATKLDIRNGINVISFEKDGVAQIFKNRCASCHTHDHSYFATYAGVKSRAASAMGQILSGGMPTDGPLPQKDINLIQQWIKTGRAR